jgi:hypothetical protein
MDDIVAAGAPLLAWFTAGVLWLCAGYLLRRMRTIRRVATATALPAHVSG